MLAEFIAAKREVIIERTRLRAAARGENERRQVEFANGIPMFLDQLGMALRLAESGAPVDALQIGDSAARHGGDLLRIGLTIAEVVHVYGDVCQTVTSLAIEESVQLSGEEFQTLNLCLDDAIAQAVTAYARETERAVALDANERLGTLAHEMRNTLTTALLTFDSVKAGRVAIGGSTGMVLERSLLGLVTLVDRALANLRLDAVIEHVERIGVAEMIESIEIGAAIQAQAQGLRFSSSQIDRAVTVDADRQTLTASIGNLLHNAFKFTRAGSAVALRAMVTADRVQFQVEDECGGLPPGSTEAIFRPFVQRGSDRTGAGLGLTICAKAAKASGGALTVRDVPGKGCVFTLELPRSAPSSVVAVGHV